MLPDLRFVVGAVVATALLAVTALGLGTTVHLAQQTKLGPLEASRMFAFTPPAGLRSVGEDDPFSRIPLAPAGMLPAEPLVPLAAEITAVAASEMPVAEPVAAETVAGDHDAVDERAVVDPPLLEDLGSSETAAVEPRSEPQAETALPIIAEPVPQPALDSAPAVAAVAPEPDVSPTVATAPAEPEPVVPVPAAETVPASAPATPIETAAAEPDSPTAADNEPIGSLPEPATQPTSVRKAEPKSARNARPKSARKAEPQPKQQKAAAQPKPKPKPKAKRRAQSTASVSSQNSAQPFGFGLFGNPPQPAAKKAGAQQTNWFGLGN